VVEKPDFENVEVKWKVEDFSVYGTLTRPKGEASRSAVVFVAGSGPTDRDWCSPLLPGKNGSGKSLAEALAREGFVTLRYDKLASGPHVRENITKLIGRLSMQSHLEELSGAVETIIAEKAVSKDDVFVLTNSEGAVHAVNYQLQATDCRFKGLVLTGAPGRAVGDVARSQIFNQVKQLPDAEILMKFYDNAVADFLAGKSVVLDASLPEGVKFLLKSLESPANLPFSRELWAYSLPRYLAKVNSPFLVLIGKKDIQVDWQVDGNALQAAAISKGGAAFVFPENANHVLKHEEKARENLVAAEVGLRYNAEDAVLDQEALTSILGWLQKHASN
jgi:uncharacterized protein